MKKFYFVLCCMLIIPVLFLFAGCSTKDNINIRISDGYVQWSYEGEDDWVNIISVDDIKETLGESYKGEAGTNGREIELRKEGGYLQWRYVGESNWKSLAGDMYTISFDSQGGTNVDSITNIPENTKVKKPTDPTRDGYLFDGWYYQDEKWSFIGYSVCENMTFTAHWNPIFNMENNKILSLTPYASTLKTLNIPSTIDGVEITEIGNEAFRGNLMLEKVVIPDSIKKICSGAFYDCGFLTSITISNNLKEIGNNVFLGCYNLTEVNITSLESWFNQSYGDYGAGFSSAYHLYLNGVELTEITIPKTITEIKDSALCMASYITSITIPDSITSIGEKAFYNCSSLTSVIIPDVVTNIENYTFYGCTSLISVTIPNSVTSIGSHAFSGCNALASIIIPDSVTSIGTTAFDSNKPMDVHISSLESWFNIDFAGSSNPLSPACPFGSAYHLYLNGAELTEIIIPKTITEIKDYALDGASYITLITIPNSVISIGYYAFNNCSSLISITIPESVTSIGSYAFSGCNALASIIISSGVTGVGFRAFRNCSSLTIYCEATSQPTSWASDWNYSKCPVYWYSETQPTTSGNYWHYVDGEVTKW